MACPGDRRRGNERIVYDGDGQLYSSMMDYALPRAENTTSHLSSMENAISDQCSGGKKGWEKQMYRRASGDL